MQQLYNFLTEWACSRRVHQARLPRNVALDLRPHSISIILPSRELRHPSLQVQKEIHARSDPACGRARRRKADAPAVGRGGRSKQEDERTH